MRSKILPKLPDAIADTDREKKLDKIARKIAEFTVDLQAVSPPKYFPISEAKAGKDHRVEFVEFWLRAQRQVNSPCGPQGKTLDESPPAEKAAYEKLGIAKAVNFNSRTHPHISRYVS